MPHAYIQEAMQFIAIAAVMLFALAVAEFIDWK